MSCWFMPTFKKKIFKMFAYAASLSLFATFFFRICAFKMCYKFLYNKEYILNVIVFVPLKYVTNSYIIRNIF